MSQAPPARFVVTGMPRSGTTYTAAVLCRLGLDCGHEEVFHPHTSGFTGFGRWDGDASWLAVPFLDQLPPDVRVVHQVRHPLRVAGSLVGTAFLEPAPWLSVRRDDAWATLKWRARRALVRRGHLDQVTATPRPTSAFLSFLRGRLPQVWDEPTPVERALRFWVDWNRMALDSVRGAGALRLPLETFTAETAVALAAYVGLPVTPEQGALAISKVPANLNQRAHTTLTWGDVPWGRAAEDTAALAQELGYDPADPTRPPRGPSA